MGHIAHVIFFNEFNHYKYGALCDGWIEFLEFFKSKDVVWVRTVEPRQVREGVLLNVPKME